MKNMNTNNRFITVLTLIVAVAISASNAFAHSDLLRSRPAAGDALEQSPKTVELTFKKEMQAVSMNSIAVTDQNGRRVDKNNVLLSQDGKQMTNELEELASGTYTVEWRALSADDHTIKGAFTFAVALVANTGTAQIAPPYQPSTNEQVPMTHKMPMQESGTTWVQSAIRWLMYLAMMTLFGGFVFRLLVLKPSLDQASVLSDNERSLGLRQGDNRFVRLTSLSLALLAACALASLILQTSTVLDVSIAQALAPSGFSQILTETSYGPPWALQMTAILALFILVYYIARQIRSDKSEPKAITVPTSLLWIGLGMSSLVFLPSSLTGHARAAANEYRFAIISDWLHLIGVGVWVGGLFHMALTMPKSIMHLQGARRLFVISCVTPYGQVLSLRIILFLPMVGLGGINTFVLAPRAKRTIGPAADDAPAINRSFYRSFRIEAAIGVAVLLLAAILVFLPPARQHEMQMPGMDMSKSTPQPTP